MKNILEIDKIGGRGGKNLTFHYNVEGYSMELQAEEGDVFPGYCESM